MRALTSRISLALAIVLSFALSGIAPAARAQSRKPNIIYIMADDLGFGDLGCYGQKQIQTPNIDKMASEGMRFSQAYAGSTVCAPSRCVLMTGLHTGHCYIRGNRRDPLPEDEVTVAEVLKEVGYQTALIGKWGLGEAETSGHPNRQGFDYFFGYLNQRHAHNYYPTYLWRNEEKVPLENVVPGEDAVGAGVAFTKVQYSHDLFAKEALEFLDRAKDKPFFLYLALTIPHANDEARDKGMEVPDFGPYANESWPEQEKGFAAMVTRMDGDMGKLFDKLKALGIDDNTIVFFTSDNGPHREGGHDPDFFHSSGPLRGIKRDLYEGGIRVPFIARWPGVIEANSINNTPIAFWDFLPTAAELAGAPLPKKVALDGESIVPALKGETMSDQRVFFWEFYERGGALAVRRGRWKAVRKNYLNSPTELYDLSKDIGEKKDLARQYPQIVRQLERDMIAQHKDSDLWHFPGERLNAILGR